MGDPIGKLSPGEQALAQALDGMLNPGGDQPEEEGTPPSLRDRLLGIRERLSSAKDLRRTIQEADEAGATPEIVSLFADLFRRADEIGIKRLSFTYSPQEAKEKWFSFSPAEVEEHLRTWAKAGNLSAQEVVEGLGEFSQNMFLRDLLWEVVKRIERPSRAITSYGGLFTFLEDLVEEHLVQRVINPQRLAERGVVIQRAKEIYYYLPVRGVQIAILGWPFVKEAETRAIARQKEQERKAQDLQAEATPGLTPIAVSDGQEGNLALMLGGNRRVLIETKRQNGQMMARVVKVVSVWIQTSLPSDWVVWSPERAYVPLRGSQWPLPEIPRSLKIWEEKIRQAKKGQAQLMEERERQKQASQQRLAPVTSIATFPVSFEGQALTRLLRGETGVVAAYNWNFQWGPDTGLFAIAIERGGEELLRLREVVTDLPFPANLRGKRLPQLEVKEGKDGSLGVRLARLPKMEGKVYQGLKMVEKLLQLRLNGEHRSLSGEPAPGNGNNHTG